MTRSIFALRDGAGLTPLKACARRCGTMPLAMNKGLCLKIIREEHAALSAVLSTLLMMVRETHRVHRTPDFRSMRAMLFYIDEFPERLHHVKESTMLFPRLRELAEEAEPVLARLDKDHRSGGPRVRELAHALTAWEMLGDSRREAFERALEAYAAFYREHMRLEETEVLPLAERCFGEADWAMLDRAFGAQRDPLAGGRPEAPYEALFRTIVRITPSPFGVGDASAQ
jgi:hemerythrin-like domain-containing protein